MTDKLSDAGIENYIQELPNEVLERVQLEVQGMSMPWQYNAYASQGVDEDGFSLSASPGDKDDSKQEREALQEECWRKFNRNPQINTSVRGLMGRLTGMGFEATSEIQEIQELIDEIELDWRNRLYTFWPKYVGRSNVEGELFLLLTLHPDGFVEIDFIDPAVINMQGDGDSGIIFHSSKTTMPLFYNISTNGTITDQIPSIFVAKYPETVFDARKHKHYDKTLHKNSKKRHNIYKRFHGFNRFVVSWDKGFVTKRAISHLRTTIEWLNHYENLKKYEIDHKKSSGAYVWVFKFVDARAFKLWLTLSDEDRRKTGIQAKKTPGSSLVLPPGVELDCKNPQLTAIRNQDTDIKEMVASGLNEPEDIMTGTSSGTYASVKASRGPMSDRISDEIAYFDRFLKYDFWAAVFFLRSAATKFPQTFKVRQAVSFDKKQEPVFKSVVKKPEQLIDINYPISEVIDYDARAKGLLGVKHGPIAETIGIPNSRVARMMGIGGYGRARLRKATEDDKYPELVYEMGVDAETLQEGTEGEPGKKAKPAAATKPKSKKPRKSSAQ